MRLLRSLRSLAMTLMLLFTSICFAQEAPVTVEAKVIPSQITLGGELRLLIQVDRPVKFSVEPPSPKTNLAPFEIKKVDVSPFVQGKNRVRETFVLTLTVFELGDLKIPAMPVFYKDAQGGPGQVFTKAVPVKVLSVGRKPTDKDDIRPIKGPVSLGLAAWRNFILGVLAGVLVLFLAVKIVLRARRKKAVDLESLKPPHERAYLELERLRKKALLEAGKVKEFYSELADILRRYLERRYEIETLELTTFEIVRNLKEKEIASSVVEKVKDVLQDADLVKFAKYVPPKSLAEKLISELCETVELTKIVEQPVERK